MKKQQVSAEVKRSVYASAMNVAEKGNLTEVNKQLEKLDPEGTKARKDYLEDAEFKLGERVRTHDGHEGTVVGVTASGTMIREYSIQVEGKKHLYVRPEVSLRIGTTYLRAKERQEI